MTEPTPYLTNEFVRQRLAETAPGALHLLARVYGCDTAAEFCRRLETERPSLETAVTRLVRAGLSQRHTKVFGPLPINDDSIDRLDQALTAATEANARLTQELAEANEKFQEAAHRLHTVNRSHFLRLADHLRELADDLNPEGSNQ